jgi:hypothetical protein
MILTLTKILVEPAVLIKSARNRQSSDMGFDSGGSIFFALGFGGGRVTSREEIVRCSWAQGEPAFSSSPLLWSVGSLLHSRSVRCELKPARWL